MKLFHNTSITRKLNLVILLTCSVALLIATVALVAFQLYTFRQGFARDMAVLAQIIADESTAAVAFNNDKDAGEILHALKAKPHILCACIQLPDGSIFAHYGPMDDRAELRTMPANGSRFEGRFLLQGQPVKLNGQDLGTLYLRSDYETVYDELLRLYAGIFLVVLVVSLSLAFVLSSRLQRLITEPILRLADTARGIATRKDYSLRAEKREDDELGVFTDAFNQMLDQIQAQDAALQTAQKQLASQVEALQERARLATFDAVIGLAMTRNDPLPEMLQACAKAMVEHLGAARACLWSFNAPDRLLELQASAGLDHTEAGAANRVALGRCPIGQIGQTQQPLFTNALQADELARDCEWVKLAQLTAFAGFPLLVGDRLVGVMAMYSRQPITEAAIQTLGSVANAVALGLERKGTEAALTESEERFRSLFQNASIGLYRTTPTGRVIMANPTLVSLLGYPSFEDLAAVTVSQSGYLDPKDRRRFQEIVETQGEISGMETEWRHFDGKTIHVRESAKAIRNAQGVTIYYEGTVEDITARRQAQQELEALHKQLLETSRQAGMAEVATGVLHNVGNVLNSVNVSATLVREKLQHSEIATLAKVATLLEEHRTDMAEFLTADPKGQVVPGFIIGLAGHLQRELAELRKEHDQLANNLEHIKDIVAMQQNYAKVSGFLETVAIDALVDDALQINTAGFSRHGVRVVRRYSPVPPVTVDRHKVLQILVNLIHNAKYALEDATQPDRVLTVGIELNRHRRFRITVADNGVGIAPENLTRIFGHGFTTRKNGHGFGLHSGANAAREMGGTLSAHSEGVGRGATFTLELPLSQADTGPATP